MSSTSDRWFTSQLGRHRYFDWGGFRYRVTHAGFHRYQAFCNGQIIRDRLPNMVEAKAFVEHVSGYRGRRIAS